MQHESSSVNAQVERICDEIRQRGECLVGRAQLRALCEGEVSPAGQWHAIAKIAISERLSFSFFPDGSVRFATLESTSA